jgi:hypothetical protein
MFVQHGKAIITAKKIALIAKLFGEVLDYKIFVKEELYLVL